jgi:hypothetical protein
VTVWDNHLDFMSIGEFGALGLIHFQDEFTWNAFDRSG